MRLTTKISGLLAASALAVAAVIPAAAALSYTLYCDASTVSPGNASATAAQLTSDATPGWGGVHLTSTGVSQVSDITFLGTDYNMTTGDCGGGSPRFEIDTPSGNIFVYIGPAPNFTACGSGWQTTGNLLASPDLRVDTSQVGGTFYDTWANAVALAGTYAVSDLVVVVDGGWSQAGGVQTALIDNVTVNQDVVTFEAAGPSVATDKESCKKDGWQSLVREDGSTFKNQGDCVSYTNNGK
jgi:hypothetical protein